jgi:hypothetical protein
MNNIVAMRQYNVDICHELKNSYQQIQCGSMTQHIHVGKTKRTDESAPEFFIYK